MRGALVAGSILAICLLFIILQFAGDVEGDMRGRFDGIDSCDQDGWLSTASAADLQGSEEISALIGMFSGDDEEASAWASEMLCVTGTPAIDPLIGALESPDPDVRDWASRTLACIGDPAIGSLIKELALGTGPETEGASLTLVRIGEPALPALEALRQSGNEVQQKRAADVIESICAEPD